MGAFWKECNARSDAQKLELPHRECMARRMPEARARDLAMANKAGLDRPMNVPQLMRAVYGDEPKRQPALIVMLRRPWERMHAAYYNYQQYGKRFGSHADGEATWAAEAVGAFRRCASNFTVDDCALRFESLARENEEVFYHCDQLIKGMYSVFLPAWRAQHQRLLALRSEDYFASPRRVLERAMAHIGLPPPTDEAGWAPLLDGRRTIHGTRPAAGTPPMAPATVAMLKEFYAPSLTRLTEQLADVEDAAEWRRWARDGA